MLKLAVLRSTACADAVSMWAVPIPSRPAAQAMQVITMHALGDVPSPPIVGAIQGAPAREAALRLLRDELLQQPRTARCGCAAHIAQLCYASSRCHCLRPTAAQARWASGASA